MSLVVRKMPVPTIEPTVSRAPSQVLKPRTRRDSWGGAGGTSVACGVIPTPVCKACLLLFGERDHRLGAAVGGGGHYAGLALAVGALAGDAAARCAVGGIGALLRRQAGALELRLVVFDHLGRSVGSGDSEGRRARLGVGGVVGPLHRAAGVDRQPGGEVLRRAGAAEGGR